MEFLHNNNNNTLNLSFAPVFHFFYKLDLTNMMSTTFDIIYYKLVTHTFILYIILYLCILSLFCCKQHQ